MGSPPQADAERTIFFTAMTTEYYLEQQVLLLASRDWNVRRAARDALIEAGSPGLSAVLRGLDHAEPPVRKGCLDFLDHHADELCTDDLRRVALNDPVPQVRRFAVHALSCIRCKARPLGTDLIEFLTSVAVRTDENVNVRREAIFQLNHQGQDAQITAVLRLVLEQESDRELRKAAHRALRLHDPDYRRLTDERARQASLARTSGR